MKKTITVCPYCGTGCKIYLNVENNKIVSAEGAPGHTNEGELCLKGYYGWDYTSDTRILTPRLRSPMIRRQKGAPLQAVSWDEAIEFASSRLKAIKEKYGPDSIMTTGSSRGPGNEVNYLMQKFARAVIGTNNVDCCARVCHGPSVAGLLKSTGDGAMSNSIVELGKTDLLFIFGYNPTDAHPIVAQRMVKAKAKSTKIIVFDPRKSETARMADLYVPIRNGSNVAVVNALLNVLITENMVDKKFVADHANGYDELWEIVKNYTPESIEGISGVPAEQIRTAARMYGQAKTATICWGMGVTQFYQGVETVQALASMAILTGNLGKPNVGVAPVRGQNNVQGACDMGVLPNLFVGYQKITDSKIREKFAKAWGVKSLPSEIGVHLTQVPERILEGKLHANYVMGEDPLQTEPDLATVREAFLKLDLLIVQDIFMTKTASIADVIFPATATAEHEAVYTSADRGFQRGYKAVEPVGDVKHDWEIISLMATAMGYPQKYNNTKEIWDELRELSPLFYGATYEKMEGMGFVHWPCLTLDDPGAEYLFKDGKFSTPDERANLFTVEWTPPKDLVDDKYSLALCTVREVGHYSCRSMTGNCKALATLADEPGYAQINSEDAKAYGIRDQQLIWVHSRKGKVITRASVSDRTNKGAVYMTYQWWVGACNELVTENLSPICKTPEYKYCAVYLEQIEDQRWAEEYVRDVYSKMKKRLLDVEETAESLRGKSAEEVAAIKVVEPEGLTLVRDEIQASNLAEPAL